MTRGGTTSPHRGDQATALAPEGPAPAFFSIRRGCDGPA